MIEFAYGHIIKPIREGKMPSVMCLLQLNNEIKIYLRLIKILK